MNDDKHIGYLFAKTGEPGFRFICRDCALWYERKDGVVHSPIYEVNVKPYKATCVCCGEIVLNGGSNVELFDGR